MLARLGIVVLLATPAFAETWTVGPDPTLYDFSRIQSAVNAAQPGDTVCVAPGTYDRFEVTKPIQVLGSGSDTCFVQSDAGMGTLGIYVAIINSGYARVGGFQLLPDIEDNNGAPWLQVINSQAPVEIFDIRMVVDEPHFGTSGFVVVSNSRQVVFAGCHVLGPADFSVDLASQGVSSVIDGYDGMWTYRSNVWISDCTFEGNATIHCYTGTFGGSGQAGHGIEVDESSVVISNSVLRGGQGSASALNCPAIDAGAGLRGKFASVSEIHHGPNTLTLGGYGPGDAAPGPGALVGGPAAFYYGSELPIGGDSESGTQGEAIAQANDNVTLQPTEGVRPTLRPDHYVLPIGSTVTFEHSGIPNALHWTVFSENTSTAGLATPVVGKVFVDAAQSGLFAPTFLDPGGLASEVLAVPLDPNLIGFSGIFQAAQVGAGPIVVSNPTVLAITP